MKYTKKQVGYKQRWFYDDKNMAFVRESDGKVVYYHDKLWLNVHLSPDNLQLRDQDLDRYCTEQSK